VTSLPNAAPSGAACSDRRRSFSGFDSRLFPHVALLSRASLVNSAGAAQYYLFKIFANTVHRRIKESSDFGLSIEKQEIFK
jgi:hypothetical protein